MLGIAKTSRNYTETPMAYFDKIPAKLKTTRAVWNTLLQCITPRWGGSYSAMDQVIKEVIPRYIGSQSEEIMQASRDAKAHDQLLVMINDKNYLAARDFAKKIQEASRVPSTFDGLYILAAVAAQHLQHYESCYENARIATSLTPHRPAAWSQVGYCAYMLEKWHDAKNAYTHRIRIIGLNAYDVYQLGTVSSFLNEYKAAYYLLKKAKELGYEEKAFIDQYSLSIEQNRPEVIDSVEPDIWSFIEPL